MVISRRQWMIGLAASAVAVPLAGCASGQPTTPSTGAGAPSSDPSAQAAQAAAAATALVRAGATLPTAIASAPITDSNLAGGTFIIYSVTTAGSSTLLQYGIDYAKTPAGDLDIAHEWEAVLVAGEKTIRPTGWYGGTFFERRSALGLQSRVALAASPARVSMVVSYPALPAEVTQVEVKSPLFGSLTVPVNHSLSIPAGTPEVPILGRVVYQDFFHPEIAAPLIVTVHAVRRIPNGTAIYYSLAFPEGTSPIPDVWTWGGHNGMLSWILPYKMFPETFGAIDRNSMTGYTQLIVGGPGDRTGLSSYGRDLNDKVGEGNAVAGIAILPALPASSSRVDVLIGGQQLVQDVPIADGALTPPGGPTETALGNGWPSYNDTALAGVTAKQIEESTFPLFERVKVDSVTTDHNRLDLESDVLFEYNKATLTPKADRVIAKAVSLITASGKTGKLQIVGYTDNTGSPATNQELSLRRAKAVAARLQSGLTTGYTFETIGRGEADPVASNKTNAGRALNRRVEIILP